MSDKYNGNMKKVEDACEGRAQQGSTCLSTQNEIVKCEDYGVKVNRCDKN